VDFDLQLIDGDSGATFGILKNNIINTGN